jgi:hypothetical protein
MLGKKPDLQKYQHKLSDKQDNLQNMAYCLRSNIYGQSVLGTKNPLKDQIRESKPSKQTAGGYYILRNV